MISAVKSFYFLEEHDALGGLEKVGDVYKRQLDNHVVLDKAGPALGSFLLFLLDHMWPDP